MKKKTGLNSPITVFMAVIAIIAAIYFIRVELLYKTLDPARVSLIEYTSDVCDELGVPSSLAFSIFKVESSMLKKHMNFKKWETTQRFYVYSIPQISYRVAYAEGFRGAADELMDYHEAIYWAVKHIKTLMYVYDNDICKVIMAYNAGDCVSGNYGYLDKVLTIYRTYYPEYECGRKQND